MPPRLNRSKQRNNKSNRDIIHDEIQHRGYQSINDTVGFSLFGLTLSFPNQLSFFGGIGASSSDSSSSSTLNPTKVILYGGIFAILGASFFDSFVRQTLSIRVKDTDETKGSALPHLTSDGKYHGRYPNSLLTLFYPFTLLRDVVLDQPVDVSDVPFFWHAHISDEVAVKRVLTRCYGADLVELDSLEDIAKARKLDLISSLVSQNRLGTGAASELGNRFKGQRRRPLVITSPHIREVAELFSQDNYGRMFSFYRHPIDYDIHPKLKEKLPPEASANNFLTRLLSDVHVGPLGFKELGIAKQVIRQVTVAGTRDLMPESLFRIGKYFGWIPMGGEGKNESNEKDEAIAKSCIDDVLKTIPGERYADHNSPEWQVFYDANKMDCQLYELARSTWRAQIQTVIPLTLQLRRVGEGDEDQEEE